MIEFYYGMNIMNGSVGELGLYWIRSRFIKNSYFAPNYTKIKNVLAFTSDNNFTLYEGFFFRKSVQYTIFARFGPLR